MFIVKLWRAAPSEMHNHMCDHYSTRTLENGGSEIVLYSSRLHVDGMSVCVSSEREDTFDSCFVEDAASGREVDRIVPIRDSALLTPKAG